MKKIISFIIIICFSLAGFAQQRFKAGVKAGLSTSQVAGDTYAGFHKAGFVGGGFVTGRLNENWSAAFEIIYIQKGSKHNQDAEKGDFKYYLLELNYLEVPVLFQYHHKKLTIELGPGFAYLINEREYNEYQELTGLITPHNTTDVSLNIGISYTLLKNIGISWRYSNSILSIRDYALGPKTKFDTGERNNVLAFSLTYQFGKNAATE